MPERLKLIYILSSGRSGSTLLDLLLGAHPDVWTVGEAQQIRAWMGAGQNCGCGEPFESCAFWRDLLPTLDIDDGDTPIHYFRQNGVQGRVLHPNRIMEHFAGRQSRETQERIREYGERNLHYLSSVREQALKTQERVTWLVDASKDPYRLLWLEASGLFDIRVIHIVKDPRSFVYSMTKKAGDTLKVKTRFTTRWAIENGLMKRYTASVFGDRARTLHYEALAEWPAPNMQDLGAWLGLDYPPELVDQFRDVDNHGVSGNAMRWGTDPIRLDEKWRTKLPARDAQAIWLLTTPTRVALGYR